MMTAHGAVEDALQAMKIGARDYVTKPFRVEQILDVVRRALAASPPAPTVRNVETEGAPRPSPRSVAAGPAGVPGGASSGGLASSGTSGLSTRGASGAGTAGAAEDDGPGSGLASRRGAEAPAPETVAAWLRARVARQALPVPEELHHGDLDLRGMLRLAETVYVDELLRMTEGNVSRAAEIAGITRPNLHRKIQDLGLPVSVYRRA
jgi:DNA-binding NtrC family response regulator